MVSTTTPCRLRVPACPALDRGRPARPPRRGRRGRRRAGTTSPGRWTAWRDPALAAAAGRLDRRGTCTGSPTVARDGAAARAARPRMPGRAGAAQGEEPLGVGPGVDGVGARRRPRGAPGRPARGAGAPRGRRRHRRPVRVRRLPGLAAPAARGTSGLPALRLSDGRREWVGRRRRARSGPSRPRRTSCSAPSPVAAARPRSGGLRLDDRPLALPRRHLAVSVAAVADSADRTSHHTPPTGDVHLTQPRKAGHPCPPSPPPPHRPRRAAAAKQQQIWSSGDYNRIAAITVPVSEALVAARRPPARAQHVLDVATGTGHAALAAARRGAHVTGIDYVPGLLDIARRRAAAEDLPSTSSRPSPRTCRSTDGSFDHVVSAIGVMFAADHARAAAELVRVTRPGGRDLAGELDAHRLHRPAAQDGRRPRPAAAGRPAADPVGRPRTPCATCSATRSSTSPPAGPRCRSGSRRPEAFADFFLTYYGPTHAAAAAARRGRAARRCATTWSLSRPTRTAATDGSFVSDWEYLVVTATRR